MILEKIKNELLKNHIIFKEVESSIYNYEIHYSDKLIS